MYRVILSTILKMRFTNTTKYCVTLLQKNRTGDLMSRISEDVSKVRMYFGPALMYSINTIALFIIVISYMVSIAPSLTLYTLLPLPILSVTIYKLSRTINIRSTAVQETLAKLSCLCARELQWNRSD